MPLLVSILITCIAGGVLSVLLTALVAWRVHPSWIPTFISYAVGTLLGAVFLELLPHIFETSTNHHESAAYILGGILLFFLMEKLVMWRHSHDHEQVEAASHPTYPGPDTDHGRAGLMIIVGDTIHNFTDGVVIAAAFLADVKLGVVTAFAIIAHEIPQEIGDFLILLHSGYSRPQALLLNVISSLATIIGALLAYFSLQQLQSWVPVLLALAASSMLYIAVADLIPGLHKRVSLKATIQQVSLIVMGIGTIRLVHVFVGQ